MKLVQFYLPNSGVRTGLLEGNTIKDITSVDPGLGRVDEILQISYEDDVAIEEVVEGALKGKDADEFSYHELNVAPDSSKAYLEIPLYPPEVWAFGVTYKRSADERDKDAQEDIYTRVYHSQRPELFFKATPQRCVGPNGYICIRSDSSITAVEAELAYVLGKDGQIVGYTICNDVSAWDIERDNPLYLPQSKIYLGCCALGPVLVTSSEIEDPYDLNISCRIFKGGKMAFEESVSSSLLDRKLEELTEYLLRDNYIPLGTAVSTGTGIMVPNNLALEEGDRVEIEIENIGVLSNPVRQL